MQNEEKILIYLQDIAEGIGKLDRKIDAVEESLNARMDAVEETLNKRIDAVEESLNARMDELEKTLNARIDAVEESLNARIDVVEESLNVRMNEIEKSLNEKIDYSHDALLGLITHNKENIELLLIPFSDRNIHIKSEVDKIPGIERRLDEVEIVVGNHSDAIRKLSYA